MRNRQPLVLYALVISVVVMTTKNVFAQADDVPEAMDVFSEKSVFAPGGRELNNAMESNFQEFLRSYDPYAEYIGPKKGNRETALVRNRFFGFEILDVYDRKYVLPYQRGPLADAGIVDITELIAINGTEVAGLSIDQIGELLPSSRVAADLTLIIDSAPRIVTLRARPVFLESVELARVNERTVIRIREFVREDTFESLERILEETQNNSGQREIVIDLRFCQGGDLYAAFNAASLFVPSGSTLAYLRDSKRRIKRVGSLVVNKTYDQVPLVFWVSHRTASAAESFIRAISAHTDVLVAGEQTYGKCVSQTEYKLNNGARLVLSNYEVLAPDRKYCRGEGIVPQQRVDNALTLPTKRLVEVSNSGF